MGQYSLADVQQPTQAGQFSASDVQTVHPADDTGVWASLKRSASNISHLPGAIADAFSKPPQDDAEKAIMGNTAGTRFEGDAKISLAMKRLFADPMKAERDKAAQMRELAKTQTDEQANNAYNGTNHLANMHSIAGYVPVLGPMAADMTQRYLSDDKSGAVTDLATAVAGPKIAEGAVNGATSLIRGAAPSVAERIYQSALKPSTTIPAAQRAAMTQTGISSAIPVSESGLTKLRGLVDDLNGKIKDQISSGAKQGATIEPNAIASRLDQLKAKFSKQVLPDEDLATIDTAKAQFLKNNQNPIPVDEAQALKVGTYQQLRGKYGQFGAARVEAEKALARGIKEELEAQFPEIKGLNAQESKFINLDGPLEHAVSRIANRNLISLTGRIASGAAGTTIGAASGDLSHAAMGSVATLVLHEVATNPMVQSKLAMAISKAGKIPPAVAIQRVGQYVNALSQSVNSGDQSSR